MKTSLRILAILLALMLSLSACGGTETTTTAPDTSASQSSTQPRTENPDFVGNDYTEMLEELRHKVFINGKQISVPFTLKDLGEGYTFSGDPLFMEDDDGTPFIAEDIYFNGEKVIFVAVEGDKEGYEKGGDAYLENAKIYYINPRSTSSIAYSFDGIEYGDSSIVLLERFGEPNSKGDKNSDTDGAYGYFSKKSNNNYVSFYFKNGKINDISFSYKDI